MGKRALWNLPGDRLRQRPGRRKRLRATRCTGASNHSPQWILRIGDQIGIARDIGRAFHQKHPPGCYPQGTVTGEFGKSFGLHLAERKSDKESLRGGPGPGFRCCQRTCANGAETRWHTDAAAHKRRHTATPLRCAT